MTFKLAQISCSPGGWPGGWVGGWWDFEIRDQLKLRLELTKMSRKCQLQLNSGEASREDLQIIAE